MKISRDDLDDVLEQARVGDSDVDIREDYPWEGGQTCLGLVFQYEGDWESFLVALAIYTYHEGGPERAREVLRVPKMVRRDSMGRGFIYFWPYGGLELTD